MSSIGDLIAILFVVFGFSVLAAAGSLEYYAASAEPKTIVQSFANNLSKPVYFIYLGRNGLFGSLSPDRDGVSYLQSASKFKGQITRILVLPLPAFYMIIATIRIIEKDSVSIALITLLVVVHSINIAAMVVSWRFGHAMMEAGYLEEEDHL